MSSIDDNFDLLEIVIGRTADRVNVASYTNSSRRDEAKGFCIVTLDSGAVDVVDVASGTVTHQLYLWPYRSAELFEHDSTYSVAHVVQHDYQATPGDLPFRKAPASAYARAEPQLSELIDFRLGWEPEAPKQSEVDFDDAKSFVCSLR